MIVGTPLAVVRAGVERDVVRGRLEELGVPPLERELGAGVALPEERDGVEPEERLMPPELRLVPPDDRLTPPDELPPEERLVARGMLPDDLLVPPDDRLTPPDDLLVPPDDRLTPPDELPPEERLGAAREVPPDERLTPPDDRLAPPDEPPEDRLTPPDEPPDERDPPLLLFETRWASTKFTGAANSATANTASRKKKNRLGVGISHLRGLTRA